MAYQATTSPESPSWLRPKPQTNLNPAPAAAPRLPARPNSLLRIEVVGCSDGGQSPRPIPAACGKRGGRPRGTRPEAAPRAVERKGPGLDVADDPLTLGPDLGRSLGVP